MSDLVSQGGKLVVRDGKLGTGQACCCDCCTHVFELDCLADFFAEPGDRAFLTTIEIPPGVGTPAKVKMVGTVDDVLLKDDEPWPPGTEEDAEAYSFDYEWLESNPTFTIEALDTRGDNLGFIEVSIYITCETGDFSVLCEPGDPPVDLPCNPLP